MIFKSLNPNKNEIVLKSISIFSIRVLGYGFGFLFTWIIANKFGAKIQGIFSISFLFLSIGVMVSKLGIETSIVKWIANSSSKNNQKYIFYKSLKTVFVSSIIVSSFIFFLAPFVALMYDKPNVLMSIRIAAIGVPLLSILDVSSNFFTGKKQTTYFSLYYHFGKFLAPFFFVLGFYLLNVIDSETPIISYILGLLLMAAIISLHTTFLFKDIKSNSESFLSTKNMLLESYPMLVASSIVVAMGFSDVFILGFYVSETKIGIYSVTIKLATLVSFTYNAIATIVTPKIAEFYHYKKLVQLKETITFSSRIMFICGLPFFLLLFLFSEQVLSIFGTEYIIGKNVLRILLLAQLTNVITGPVGPIFQMTDKQKKLQYFIIISLFFNVVISLLLVGPFGLEGVAFGSALGMVLWNFLGAVYLFKNMEIKTWVNFNFKKTNG